MVKIITDTSALFTVENGIHMGVDVLPLCVSIDDHQYRDLCFDTKYYIDNKYWNTNIIKKICIQNSTKVYQNVSIKFGYNFSAINVCSIFNDIFKYEYSLSDYTHDIFYKYFWVWSINECFFMYLHNT